MSTPVSGSSPFGKRAVVQPAAQVSAHVGMRPEAGESTVLHAPFAPRQGAVVRTWWAKSLERAVAEAAFEERDLRRGRTLARRARVGGLTLTSGQVHAAVTEDDAADPVTVTLRLPVLEPSMVDALVEVIASVSGWMGELMRGQLPQELVESAEEVGVELMPYGGEFDVTCTCHSWVQPCVHALAVLTQLTWWVDADPFVLTRMRGIGREGLLVRLHEMSSVERQVPSAWTPSGRGERNLPGDGGAPAGADQADGGVGPWNGEDVEVALEAAERAAVMLEEFAVGTPEGNLAGTPLPDATR